MPYLVAKADPYDGCSGNPVHTWTTTITRRAVQKAWPSLGTLTRVLVTQRDGHGEWYGRVEKMVLDGTKNNVTLTGDTFRSRFGLRSSGSGSAPEHRSPRPTTGPTTPAHRRLRRRRSPCAGGRSAAATRSSAPHHPRVLRRGRTRPRFQHGRIFYRRGAGAHELYGRVLRAYLGAAGRPRGSASR